MYIFGYTHEGKKPGQNEDSFLIGKRVISSGGAEATITPPFFAAVADGVSGETSGEVASAMALGVLSGVKPADKTDFNALTLSVHRFLKMQGSLKKLENMQTTLCALAITSETGGYAINVGDSRAYLWRGEKLTLLTKDQSLAQLLFETGQLSKAERESFAHKNVILPALGNLTAEPVPDVTKLPELRTGDVIIMCTDGFSDFVPISDAEYIMSQPEKLSVRIEKLYGRALMGGSKDNITVLGILV
ncbi:MAG: protein phosphatase 2C domain-containing protein [Ruminococcus sp.]|jgi:protein phosphatase|nr:protein phosphatase 2C domain-containing protein [Ruminococcus sp.]